MVSLALLFLEGYSSAEAELLNKYLKQKFKLRSLKLLDLVYSQSGSSEQQYFPKGCPWNHSDKIFTYKIALKRPPKLNLGKMMINNANIDAQVAQKTIILTLGIGLRYVTAR